MCRHFPCRLSSSASNVTTTALINQVAGDQGDQDGLILLTGLGRRGPGAGARRIPGFGMS